MSNGNPFADLIPKYKQNISKAESAARGAFDTLTLGVAPKVGGAIGAAGARLLYPELFEDQNFSQTYQQGRDDLRNQNNLAAEENPWSYGLGGLVGGVANPIGRGIQTVKGAVGAGAGLGAAYGLGASDKGQVGSIGVDNIGDAAISGLGGAAGTAAGAGFIQAGKFLIPKLNPLQYLPSKVAKTQLESIDIPQTIAAKEAGERLGVQLRPAEASGNPFVAAKEGALGTSAEGAQKLYKAGGESVDNQIKSVKGLYENISKEADSLLSPDERVRNAAQKIIQTENKILQEKANPLYEAAYSKKMPDDVVNSMLKEEPIIKKALKNVLSNSSYKSEIKKYGPKSLHTFDLVKRNIDDLIESNIRSGNKNEARLLSNAKKKLVSALDEQSPTYSNARKLYSSESPKIEALQNSPIGKIANRDDLTIKNIGKDIFDKQQTNPQVLKEVRDRIYKTDPEAWNSIVSQEMQRRVGSSNMGGSNFYSKILKDDVSFKQFQDALKYNPIAQKTLIDMRLAFKNLINPITAKTAAGQAKVHMNEKRNSLNSFAKVADNFMGGIYDNAAIDLILNPKWNKQLKDISKLANPKQKSLAYLNLLSSSTRAFDAVNTNINPQENNTEAPLPKAQDLPLPQESTNPFTDLIPQQPRPAQQNNLQGIIKSSAQQNGLNPEFVRQVAQVESNLNPNAKNPNSSASGLFQFTNGTWRHLVNQYGKDLDISLRDKNNPVANTKMASLYLRDNARKLTRILDREPTQGEVYASHVLGLGGANKLIKNYGKGKIASAIFPKEARVNKEIFYKNGKPVSIEQLYNFFSKKMSA